MQIHELKPADGSKKKRKRVGRGIGSGYGGTSCRGNKGQKARSGGTKYPGFEGGQTPLYKRVPKIRRFKNINKKEFAIINLSRLNKFEDGTEVTPEFLLKNKFIKKLGDGLKILGEGELKKRLIVCSNKFSKKAKKEIEAKGGEARIIK
jgi:large subunit ribosomal protein L15